MGPFKMVPGRAIEVQARRRPTRYVNKPNVFQLASRALGIFKVTLKREEMLRNEIYLVVTETQVTDQTVVIENIFFKLLELGFILEVRILFQ